MLLLASWSEPAAAQWTRVEAIPAGFVIAVRSFGDTIVAGSTTLAFVSTDAGATWRTTQPAVIGVPIQSMFVRNRTIYLGTAGLGVFTSTDLGQSWQAFNTGLVGGFQDTQLDVSDLRVRGDSLYASTFGAGVYVRGLRGVTTWHHFGEQFEPDQASNVRSLATDGFRVLAMAGANGSVFFRDPADPEWTVSWLNNVGLHPSVEAFGAVWSGTGWVVATGVGRFIYHSTAGQEPWTAVNLGLGLVNSGTLAVQGHRVLGAFNRNNDVVLLRSDDDGASWPLIEVQPQTFIFQMTTVGTELYAGRTDGLWRRSTATLDVVPGQAGEGLQLAISGAQPVARELHLRFNMPVAGDAALDVFEITGRRASHREEPALSAGVHELSWSTRDLSPGVYQVRLSALGRQEAVRMVHVR